MFAPLKRYRPWFLTSITFKGPLSENARLSWVRSCGILPPCCLKRGPPRHVCPACTCVLHARGAHRSHQPTLGQSPGGADLSICAAVHPGGEIILGVFTLLGMNHTRTISF
ncbi:hypothetical protein H1C71_015211 [Ictidomys tridecemlineatus]|nr:hypothetical protein H1C71_015211 [Ictidomys tridecemlineatus]KAG3260350.1 hypothetical protein H1C71_015211 [Ictidomys tridecemlineatus]KAG3260351.1 hypothetical protein H1C71_015211 [Ictidomys tridecemlineatus]